MYSIIDFGALADGKTVCTKAIQSAIDRAAADGGGTVHIPAGRYLTGNLELKSNTELYLGPGSVLEAVKDFTDYRFTSLPMTYAIMNGLPLPDKVSGFIYADYADNVGVRGAGTLEGNGKWNDYFPQEDDRYQRRPHMLLFNHCTRVKVSGVTLIDPAMYAVYSVACDDVLVDGISVHSRESNNGDGVDFDGGKNVRVCNCFLDTGDDAISLKTTLRDEPCEDFVITNCICSAVWSAVRLGTESTGDMRNISISNCVFRGCNDGLKIQDCSHGIYENISISNISMYDVHRPAFITVNSYRLSRYDESILPAAGGMKNISIENVTAYMSGWGSDFNRNYFIVSGTPEKRIESIRFSNCRFVITGGYTGDRPLAIPEFYDYSFLYPDVFTLPHYLSSCGPYLRHIDSIEFTGCSFELANEDSRPLIFAYGIGRLGFVHSSFRGKCPDWLVSEDSGVHLHSVVFNGEDAIAYSTLKSKELEVFDTFRETGVRTIERLKEYAADIDVCEKLEEYEVIPDSAWTVSSGVCDAEVWETEVLMKSNECYLYLPYFYGNVQVFINDKPAGAYEIDKAYRVSAIWARDISAHAVRGANNIRLVWQDKNDRGGIVCKMPFEDFDEYGTGLHREAEIRYRV